MVEMKQLFNFRSMVRLCITFILLRALSTCGAQDIRNPCISALNLEEVGDNVQEGVYVIVTPGARVAEGTDLSFLCCVYTGLTGLSPPSWKIEPDSNEESFVVGPEKIYPLQYGRILLPHTMNATATSSINNTNVICTASAASTVLMSNLTTIIVMGPLQAPNPVLEVVDKILIVRWNPVFSWPEHPITGYRVTLLRSNGLERLLDETISDTSIRIQVQQASLLLGTFLEECEELIFSVSAINELGEGEQGSITGGLPKTNGLTSYNSTVQVFVLFNAELEPRAEIILKTPSLCPYQTLNYTLFIEGEINGKHQTVIISDQLKIQDSPVEILISTMSYPRLSFSAQKEYTVYVYLSTAGGESIFTESTNFTSNVLSRIIEIEGLSIDDRLILAIILTILLTLVVGVSIGVFSVLAVKKCRRSEKIILKAETEMRPPPGVQESTKPQENLAYGHGHVHSFKQ